jgi:electron transfer flavoprotein beta subunit
LKILTKVKKVVDVELNIPVDDGAIVEDDLQYVMNAWDENAVEAAVQLKENNDAETVSVTVGGEDVAAVIRKGFAMGIEEGVYVEDPALEKADSFAFAKVLQKVFEQGGDYDLVITGRQAQDTDSGQTGIILAEYLGLPCVSNVMSLEVLDDEHIKVSRLGDVGTEILEVELPAVITVSDSINEPRLPALKNIMKAKKKSFEEMELDDLDLSEEEIGADAPKSEVIEFIAPTKRKAGKKFEGDPAEITAEVVGLLVNEAKVL